MKLCESQNVGDLAGDLGHEPADAGERDRRRAERIRLGGEHRRHQGVLVELAPVVELLAGLPAVLDRTDREHEVAHPLRRVRPRHREAALDVRLDLRPQAQREASTRQQLQIVRRLGHRHRVAREGDRDRTSEPDGGRAAGGRGERDEGIVRQLGGADRVVAVGLRPDGGGLERHGTGVHVAPGLERERAGGGGSAHGDPPRHRGSRLRPGRGIRCAPSLSLNPPTRPGCASDFDLSGAPRFGRG